MEFEINDIKKKIDAYLSGDLLKKDLGEWAKSAYYDLLKGGYLEVKKIIGYPFLKLISTIHIEEDDAKDIFPCTIDEITFIRDILSGDYNENYSIDISISWDIHSDNLGLDKRKKAQYIKLISILNRYSNNQKLTEEDYNECVNIFKMLPDKLDTIPFIIETYIKSFLKNSIDWEEHRLDLYQGMGIYMQKRKTEKDILDKLIAYLECYVGKRDFGVNVLFISGVPQIIFAV